MADSGSSYNGRCLITWVVLCTTTVCLAFTVFFAFNSSVEQPFSSLFVTKNPERNILILNASSQITIFLLAELTASVLEVMRWALACRESGTSAITFVGLSRATSFFGALFLLAKGPRI